MNTSEKEIFVKIIQQFQQYFPDGNIRFSKRIGKRISHIAGSSYQIFYDEKIKYIGENIIVHYRFGQNSSAEKEAEFWQQLNRSLIGHQTP